MERQEALVQLVNVDQQEAQDHLVHKDLLERPVLLVLLEVLALEVHLEPLDRLVYQVQQDRLDRKVVEVQLGRQDSRVKWVWSGSRACQALLVLTDLMGRSVNQERLVLREIQASLAEQVIQLFLSCMSGSGQWLLSLCGCCGARQSLSPSLALSLILPSMISVSFRHL